MIIIHFLFLYTFIATNTESSPENLILFYCKQGAMKNFIRASKYGFHMDSMSSHSMVVNANKLQVYTIRLKLLKVATEHVRSARYIAFKLYSHCPYKTNSMKKFIFETKSKVMS